MNTAEDTRRSHRENRPGPAAGKRLFGLAAFAALHCLLIFLSSGRPDWGIAWVYIGLRTAVTAAGAFALSARSPELWAERTHPGEGVKAWDRPLVWSTTALLPVILLAAGLDKRFGWTGTFSVTVQWAALAIWLCADSFSKWAAAANPFYSRLVRIQTDRGHAVISQGPYRWVRHPGYAGALVAGLATPIALGSLWALIPAVLFAALIAVRTALEDGTLRTELEGYQAYAQRTHYRLIPGVW
jgi:protein-S-isoprenylcysteine O-methyltransferase Ste14